VRDVFSPLAIKVVQREDEGSKEWLEGVGLLFLCE
jgi:hypothetical protein